MKKIDMKSMVTQLIFLLLLITAILLIIFSFYFIKQNNSFNEFQMEQGLEKISQEKAQVVSLTMKEVENEIKNLALWVEEYLFTDENYKLPNNYRRDKRGILTRYIQENADEKYLSETSNVILPKDTELSQNLMNQIVTTEKLDKVFADTREKNPYVQWVYFTTEEGLMRILPFSRRYTEEEGLDPEQDQREAPFYKFATPEANPTREIVWTKPYLDYMGTGWMVTCAYPIYDGDNFIGVICIDVQLETLKNKLLADFRLGESGFAFLISNKGDIIYHPDHIPVEGELGEILQLNLLSNDLSLEYKSIVGAMAMGKEGVDSYYSETDHQSHIIAFSQIPNLGWSLGIEINEEDYLSRNNIFTYNFISLVVIGLFLIFLGVFLFRQYTKPILQLTKEAKKISDGNFDVVKTKSNFTEIKILLEAFNAMSIRIESYTENLKQRNKQVETIFNSIGGLLMIVTPNYEIVTINEKGFKKYGREICGLPCYKVIAGKDQPCKGCNIKKVFDSKKDASAEIALGDKIFKNAYFPMISGGENIEGIIIYSINITENVTIEKELNQSEKMVGIGQISSAIAHELKNPLATIKGSTYVMRAYNSEKKDKTLNRNIEIIDESISGAEKVIYNLLDFASTSRNVCERINLSKIIEQILLFQRKTIIKNTIDINMHFETDALIMYSNPDALKHIFLNLITNAIEALTTGGTLTIRGSYISYNDMESIKVVISDTGCGMDENIQKEIFNPFFSTKKNHSGTGLGLWITKRSIEKLAGEIKVESAPGVGTTITVILPYENFQEGEEDHESR